MMKTNPRYIAWELLKKVFIKKSFSNILLNEVSNKNINEKNKNLIFAIVHGTIANKMYLEYIVNKVIDKKRTPIEIKIILWMSIYQFKYLTYIPKYAIVNEATEISKIVNKKFAGVVNASLQKILRETPKIYEIKIKDEYKKLCLKYSYPYKLFEKIKGDYGIDVAINLIKDNNTKPNISFRINTLKISTNNFYDKYKDEYKLSKTDINDGIISEKPIVKSNLYEKGLITIQDQASIYVGQVLNPRPNTNVLDMCSAPGSKLTHLAALMKNTGKLIGYEISQNKINLINQNILRLGIKNVELICDDALNIKRKEYFDSILLDAPCSGFGVFKRKPEIKLNIDFNSIENIINIQAKLLETAFNSLKRNGILVYSTCTINKDENQNQIKKFITKHKDIEILFEKQIFGYENNTDGFYICKIIKK